MKELAFRLHKGSDLKRSIEHYCQNINTAVVLCGVGCLSKVKIRLASAKEYFEVSKDYEIVSLTGAISNGKAHIHISLADDKSMVIGGHLCEGSIVNTTCEIVLGVLEAYSSKRIFDESTGYNEIEFKEI